MFRFLRIFLPVLACLSLIEQSIGSPQAARLIRGPYLQTACNGQVTLHWRTDVASDSRVQYSTAAANLHLTASNNTLTTEHRVTLKGLESGTRYYYSIGSQNDRLVSGARYFFETEPDQSNNQETRIWVLGDSGTANSNARRVRSAYSRFTGRRYTDVILMLGDNAYESGTDQEYQAAVFRTFRKFLRQTVLWPTIGNHDVVLDSIAPRDIPYTDIFNLPKKGECGGAPSKTEDYYSFDYGSIHFVSLDSTTKDREPDGPMVRWLKRDLKTVNSDWLIAYWHHAPYSKGTHDSDEDTAMRQMRENVLPILEKHGVDLVLCGHSHSYQRSFLLHGHYGTASTFKNAFAVDKGTGREEETGAYAKSAGKSIPGTVYVVAGSSGKLDDIDLLHPAMLLTRKVFGSFVIDITGNRLDGKFVQDDGTIGDHFTLIKQ